MLLYLCFDLLFLKLRYGAGHCRFQNRVLIGINSKKLLILLLINEIAIFLESDLDMLFPPLISRQIGKHSQLVNSSRVLLCFCFLFRDLDRSERNKLYSSSFRGLYN